MSLLPADELADLRDEAELALPTLCTIQVPTQANTKGSVAVTYADTYTSVKCRIAERARYGQEREIGTALLSVSDYILTVPFDQVIQASYRVVSDALTYEIVTVDNQQSSYRTTRRATMRLIGPAG